MSNKIKSIPYRTQLFIVILLASLLPLIILGAFSYITYINEFSEKLDIGADAIAGQTRDRIDSLLNSAREYYADIYKNSDVSWLLEESNLTSDQYFDVKAPISLFYGSQSLYEYVSGYSFISRAGNFVISNNGIYDYDKTQNFDEIEELIAKKADTYIRLQWHNNMDKIQSESIPRGIVNLQGYMLVLQLPANGFEVEQALIINFDMTSIKRMLTNNLDKYSILILDNNGKLVLSSDDILSDYCINNYQELTASKSPILLDLSNGERYSIAKANSLGNDLTIFVGYNRNMVSEGADRILLLIGVLAVTVSILIAISIISARWIGQPIARIAKFFNVSTESDCNELTKIELGVKNLIVSKSNMEQIIGDQGELLLQMFITRLFRGELSTDQIERYIKQLHLEAPIHYHVITIRLTAGIKLEPLSIDDNAIHILFLEYLPEELRSTLYSPPLNDGNSIIMILAAENIALLSEKVESFLSSLQQYAEKELSVDVCAGVSTIYDDLMQIRSAFFESQEALKSIIYSEYDQNSPPSGAYYYEDLQIDKSVSLISEKTFQQDIRMAIDRCNRKKAAKCTAEFIITLPYWTTAKHEASLHIYSYLTSILSVLDEAGISQDKVFAGSERTLFKQVADLYDNDKLLDFFVNSVIEPCISALEDSREGNAPMYKIEELVKESRGNITMAECSEILGYHSSHIWRIIKSKTGMSFADYIAQEKLNAAEEMLLNSNLSVTEISEALNYTNPQNFIRFFSKHKGITPGRFRQDNKNK